MSNEHLPSEVNGQVGRGTKRNATDESDEDEEKSKRICIEQSDETPSDFKTRVSELKKQLREKLQVFWKEYKLLQIEEDENTLPQTEALKPGNQNRNRYSNVLPYDHTRVKLKGVSGYDYINASYITPDGAASSSDIQKKSYIATQGCLPNTIADFWTMVWQENARVIVMTTNENEQGRVKCAHYWPNKGETKKYRHLSIKHAKETAEKNYTLRQFLIAEQGKEEQRTVFQYHFTAWPDHGVPSEQISMLDFISKINLTLDSLGQAGPVVVHCSAGIGRTGTYIVIDSILDQLKKSGLDSKISVMEMVRLLRSQRWGMVQTDVQYKFIFSVLLQHVESLSQ